MQSKLCVKCNELKEHHLFTTDASRHDSLSIACKLCQKLLRQQNKHKIKEYSNNYYIANKETLSIKARQIYIAEKDTIQQRNKDWRENNKEWVSAYNKIYKNSHKDQINIKHYFKRNINEPFRLQTCIQTILHRTLGNLSRPGSAKEIIGCSWDDYTAYLHDRAPTAHVCNNEHPLHIDHVIPRACPFFDFNNHDHIRACFHYTNTQYLPKHLNQSKNDTLPPGFDQTAFDAWLQKQLRQIDRIHNENLSFQTVLSLQLSGDFQ